MSHNKVNNYEVDSHVAEIYDQQQNFTEDVNLLLELIGNRGPLRIFEPFCGTGRMLIPLLAAGHQLTGLDQSRVLLNCCKEKLRRMGKEAILIEGDAIADPWPAGQDVVVMGGNCLYELATPEEQEHCIRLAASALKAGGYLFLDNDHMEGPLAPAWQDTTERTSFPTGQCADGIRLESTMQTVWCDVPGRLARIRRQTKVIFPDGRIIERTHIQQKHPVSTEEMKRWLTKAGFTVEKFYGTRQCEPYQHTSPRAIFWAKKV